MKIFLTVILSAVWLTACGAPQENKLAEVDGEVITTEQLEESAGKQLFQLNEQVYRLKQQKLEELVAAMLLTKEAKKRGVSVEGLLHQEVNSKIVPVTDDEIDNFYRANKARIPVELDQVRDRIKEFLINQRVGAQRAIFIQNLRTKAKVISYLEAPPLYRAEIATFNAPSKGDKKAPVTIVKFEDFHCPFCKQVQGTFDQLLAKYDGKVRLVHKDMPIDSLHPQARMAAEAAQCAGDQGRFWRYHDLLYANAPKASLSDLRGFAKEAGLEMGVFDTCLGSGKHRAKVQKDVEEGAKLGITGTPTFYINGRELSGAQPLDSFVKVIDEELAQRKSVKSTQTTQ